MYKFLEKHGKKLHRLCEWMSGTRFGYALSRAIIPFSYIPPTMRSKTMTQKTLLELEKLITFDAMTPRYDKPMPGERFKAIILSEGFQFINFYESPVSVVYGTARKLKEG